MRKYNRYSWVLPLILLLALGALRWYQRSHPDRIPQQQRPVPTQSRARKQGADEIPAYVTRTLQYVRKNNEAPDGFVGGRRFENREKRLPLKSPEGREIHYREWDVHPDSETRNRGPERLVTGSDGSAWYSSDHYKSFTKIE